MAKTIVSKKKTAEELGAEMKAISISEFFEKNKHLLGFDNPTKALLMAVKEAVDNSLDAAEEAGILPEVAVKIKQKGEDRFIVTVQDNGPGIVKEKVKDAFGKLLFGSKFHKLKQSLTADEPVFLMRDGKAELTPIGRLVDDLLDEGQDAREIGDLDIRVPAFDPTNNRYAVRKVSHVIRHRRENEILNIKIATNRNIKVTGCHSLFTLDSSTLGVKATEARDLKVGDFLIVPRRLPALEETTEINVLDYLTLDDVQTKWLYVYGFEQSTIKALFEKAAIIHKTTDKARKFYRFETLHGTIDILDDSMKQYISKGFLPLHLVLKLGLKDAAKECSIRSYRNGQKYEFPITLELSRGLMRFLGLYVAEGHNDRRQVGFTFGKHETHLVDEIVGFANRLGLASTIEPRDRSIRLKVFGEILSKLMPKWCGHGAKEKRIPEFVFRAPVELRKAFLEAYTEGDGHVREKITYLNTVSRRLADELLYLLLTLGIVASFREKVFQGLGKTPSTGYIVHFQTGPRARAYERVPLVLLDGKSTGTVSVNPLRLLTALGAAQPRIAEKYWGILAGAGDGIHYSLDKLRGLAAGRITKTHTKRLAELGLLREDGGMYQTTARGQALVQKVNKLLAFAASDLCLLPIKEIEILDDGHEYVYDLSVPGCENFVGGLGGIACHNSRGQQGIGISAVVLYSQLTTGNPTKIWSKTEGSKKGLYLELRLNTQKNEPEIVKEESFEDGFEHGVKIEFDLVGRYRNWVADYLKQTSISNPATKIVFTAPDGTKTTFSKTINQLPVAPKEMKPHPYGVEFGTLQRMLSFTQSRGLSGFLTNEFSSVGSTSAKEICKVARLDPELAPKELGHDQIEKLLGAMQKVKIQRPPLDCLSPVGKNELEKSLKSEFPGAEFVVVRSREPEVYRGFPFLVEVAIVYGGDLPQDQPIRVLRFANRVPLLHQASACATVEAAKDVDWKRYGMTQSGGQLPVGPMALIIHMCSVWVPFISEAKTAIAPYPDIVKEMKLAIQDAARDLGRYLSGKRRRGEAHRRFLIFERYSTEVAEALSKLTGKQKAGIEKALKGMIKTKVSFEDVAGEGEAAEEGAEVKAAPAGETAAKAEEKKVEAKPVATKDEKTPKPADSKSKQKGE